MERLILFAKRPRLGRVKTRLVPPLTADQALGLYRAFLTDTIELLRSLAAGREVELCWDGPAEPEDEPANDGGRLRVTEQGPGDLGQRLLRAFQRSRELGASATVVIGADSPTLPAARIELAFQRLAGGDPLVLAPAVDGGYVLIGLRQPQPQLFAGIPWGSSDVERITRDRAAAAGLQCTTLAPWFDVDDAEGLRRLRENLNGPAASRAAATTRWFRVDRNTRTLGV